MYCDRCGTAVPQGAQFCSSCGKQVGAPAYGAPAVVQPPSTLTRSNGRVQRHIQLLATLWLANGILRFVEVGSIFIAGRLLPFLAGWPFSRPFGTWPFDFMAFGLYSVGGLLAFFGVLHLLLAWGLFERQPWARMLGLVLGVLALLRPPLGTALGIYTLWVLLPEPSGQEYDRLSRAHV
jgi:zinc ribbon protein